MLTEWLSFPPALLVNRGVIQWQEALQTGTGVSCYQYRNGFIYRGIKRTEWLTCHSERRADRNINGALK